MTKEEVLEVARKGAAAGCTGDDFLGPTLEQMYLQGIPCAVAHSRHHNDIHRLMPHVIGPSHRLRLRPFPSSFSIAWDKVIRASAFSLIEL